MYKLRIRDLREDKDLSQQKLAELLQVHQTTYSDYELDAPTCPSPCCTSWRIFMGLALIICWAGQM